MDSGEMKRARAVESEEMERGRAMDRMRGSDGERGG